MGFESKKLVLRVQQFSLFIAFLLKKIFHTHPQKKGFLKKDKNTAARAKKVGFFVLVQIFVGKKTFISIINFINFIFILIFLENEKRKKKKENRKIICFF